MTNLPAASWTSFQFNATASATNSVLTIGFRDDPSYMGLDDVAVYPIGLAPPEIQSVFRTDGMVTLTWAATVGQKISKVRIHQRAWLEQWWISLGYPVTATDSTVTVSDSIGASSAQFYRLVLAP